jgi:molecular chaperone DnaK
VVAIGAAVQAGVLAGEVKDLLLLDVTPLTLAIETLGGVATHHDSAQHHHPDQEDGDLLDGCRFADRSRSPRAAGRASLAAQNRTLGKFKLAGIPPAPRGVPQIEVTFDIDANGILNVTAKDNATGKDTRITITSSSGLSKDEVEKMAKEAEAHASEDKEKREEIEARNSLDGLVYNIEKMLKDSGDKMQGAERPKSSPAGRVQGSAWKARRASGELKSAHEKLTHASHKLAEVLYKANAAQPRKVVPAPQAPSSRRAEERRRRNRRRVRRRRRQKVGLAVQAYPPIRRNLFPEFARQGWATNGTVAVVPTSTASPFARNGLERRIPFSVVNSVCVKVVLVNMRLRLVGLAQNSS